MIRKFIPIVLIAMAAVFFTYGCNMKTDVITWGPTRGVFVAQASVSQITEPFGMCVLSAALYEDNALGNSLTGATITIGGYPLAESTPGIYQYVSLTAALFAPDAPVTLSISSSKGSVSANSAMARSVTITAPAMSSSVPVTSTCTVQWSYPDGLPSEPNNLVVAVGTTITTTIVNESIAAGIQYRIIPADTMPAPGLGTAAITTKRTAAINGATVGSALFTCGFTSTSMFSTTP